MLLKRYLELREVGKNLHIPMMDEPKLAFDKFLKASGHFLGMIEKIKGKETFVFEEENEMDILNDFAFFEYLENGKNYIELYYELHKAKLKPLEKEVLEAMQNHFTSLFEVVEVNPADHELTLQDVLFEEEDVVIIDRNYSKSAVLGSLIFTRIIPFEDLNMTSGFSFPFYEKSRNLILNEHKLNMKKPSGHSADERIFKSFFQLYKKYGIPVLYKDA